MLVVDRDAEASGDDQAQRGDRAQPGIDVDDADRDIDVFTLVVGVVVAVDER